jgi:predicted ATP-dependent protease
MWILYYLACGLKCYGTIASINEIHNYLRTRLTLIVAGMEDMKRKDAKAGTLTAFTATRLEARENMINLMCETIAQAVLYSARSEV